MKEVTYEFKESTLSLNAADLTDKIMGYLSELLRTALLERSSLLAKMRNEMELEALTTLEKEVREVLLHISAEAPELDLAETIIDRVSAAVTESIQRIIRYPVVQEEVQRSLSEDAQCSDRHTLANTILKTLIPFLLEGVQQDIQKRTKKIHHPALLEKLNHVVVSLLQRSHLVALELEIVTKKEAQDQIVSKATRQKFKHMFRPAVENSFKRYNPFSDQFNQYASYSSEDFATAIYGTIYFNVHFNDLYKMGPRMAIEKLLYEVVQNITTMDRPLPKRISIMEYLLNNIFKKINKIDVADEIELYKTAHN